MEDLFDLLPWRCLIDTHQQLFHGLPPETSVVRHVSSGLQVNVHRKAKAKAYNTCRAPQVTYRDFRGAGHVTGQASVGRRP